LFCAGITAVNCPAAAQHRRGNTTPASPPPAAPAVTPPAPSAPPPAASAAPEAEPPPDPRVTEARAHFDQGAVFFERENWEAALAEFQRAYEMLDGHPAQYTVLFNLGQTYERLFQYDLALRAYQQYLDRGGPEAEDRATVTATIRALDNLLATINVTTNVPRAEVWLDDRRIGTAPGEIRIPGGRHLVQLRATGYIPNQVEVTIVARARRDVIVNLTRIPQHRGLPPFLFGGAAGIAVVAAGVGAGFGIAALMQRSDFDRINMDPVEGHDTYMQEQRLDTMRTTALVADVSFGIAGAFAIGAGVLFFLTDFRPRTANEQQPAPQPRAHHGSMFRAFVAPSFTPGNPGLSVMGVF
jgi:hypothetical protein